MAKAKTTKTRTATKASKGRATAKAVPAKLSPAAKAWITRRANAAKSGKAA